MSEQREQREGQLGDASEHELQLRLASVSIGIVAEGGETRAQLDAVQSLGCGYAGTGPKATD